MSILRLVAIAWLVNLKSLTRSVFFSFTAVIQPIVFATIATYMFRAGHRPGTLLYTSLGAALMGTWSATLFGSGGAIAWQRFQGTLELLVASPRPFLVVMAGQTLATAALGVDPVAAVATAAALGCAYVVLGALLVRHFERLARERATLALA